MARQIRYNCSKCDKELIALEGSQAEPWKLCAQCYTKRLMKEQVHTPIKNGNDQAKEVYTVISDFANGNRMYGKHIGEAMIHDHPLLQSYVVGIMLDCIKAMAENDHITPQNEASVALCKQIQECVGEYPQYL